MEVLVEYDSGKRFKATCDGYTVSTGKGEGGDEGQDGMSPPQLLAASVGMCIGRYVIAYCQNHDIPHDDLAIEVDRDTEKAPSRTTKLHVKIRLGADLSEKDAHAMLKVADRCHITNSIRNNMSILCSLAKSEDAEKQNTDS